MNNNTVQLLGLAMAIGKDPIFIGTINSGTVVYCRDDKLVFEPSTIELMNWLLTIGSFDLIAINHDRSKHSSTVTFILNDTSIGNGCFYSGDSDLKTEILNIAFQVSAYINKSESK